MGCADRAVPVRVEAQPRSGPWTPRVTLSLAVLAAAAFVYVTAEIMPVGALPAIARLIIIAMCFNFISNSLLYFMGALSARSGLSVRDCN